MNKSSRTIVENNKKTYSVPILKRIGKINNYTQGKPGSNFDSADANGQS